MSEIERNDEGDSESANASARASASASESPNEREAELTGLPWPKTWKGAYFLVIGSFILWLLLLIALTESFA